MSTDRPLELPVRASERASRDSDRIERSRSVTTPFAAHAELAVYAPSWLSFARIPRRVSPVVDAQPLTGLSGSTYREVIESRPRKFGHAGRTPPSRASPSARRAPGFAERRPRRPRRASTAGPPNDPRGPFGPRGPTARPGTPLGARGGFVRRGARRRRRRRAPRGAPSPSTAGPGEPFAPRSPSRTAASMAKLSRDRRAGRKMEPRAENS